MSSPFPGMDPFLESQGKWEDFHTKLIGDVERYLSQTLPPRYTVRLGERSYLDMESLETEFREVFLEIHELDPHLRLVTGIEVLSPSNKRPGTVGWYQYERKRKAFLEGHANLVEIDLLRSGRRMAMAGTWPEGPYYIMVLRKAAAPHCKVWAGHFQQPLPDIPIPLAPPDVDVPLPLQELVRGVYDRSRYGLELDYSKPPRPPFTPEEAAWFAKVPS